jgi:hypothetical protein
LIKFLKVNILIFYILIILIIKKINSREYRVDRVCINAFKYADMAEMTNRPQFLSCELQDEIVERLLQEKFRIFSAEWNVFMDDLMEKLCALRSVVYCHYEDSKQTELLRETACIQVIMQLFIAYMFQRVGEIQETVPLAVGPANTPAMDIDFSLGPYSWTGRTDLWCGPMSAPAINDSTAKKNYIIVSL